MPLAGLGVDGDVRVGGEQLLDRDPRLQPREVAADAEVRTAAEGQVATDLTTYVEPVGRLAVLPRVAVRRPVEHQHLLAGRDLDAVDLHVRQRGARQALDGGLEAQALHECVRDQRGVGQQQLALRHLLTREEDGVRDQAGRGVGTTGSDHEAEAEDVPVAEPLVVDLGGDEPTEQVVAGVLSSRGDRGREVLEHLADHPHTRLRVGVATGVADQRVGVEALVLQTREGLHPRREPLPVGLRQAEQLGQHERGNGRGELGVQVHRLAVR